MATATMTLQVNSQQELESAIQGYIAQGFNLASRTPTSVTLIKRKEFSIVWFIVGVFLCVLPMLIYLIVYLAQSDQMVTITLAGAQSAAAYSATPAIPAPAVVASSSGYQLSPDGQYFWDGQQWRPITQLPAQTSPLAGQSGPLPAQSGPLPDQSAAGYGASSSSSYSSASAASHSGYQLSPDGQYFWDGQQWRPIAQLPAQTGSLPEQSATTYPPQPQQEQPDTAAGYYAQQQPQQEQPVPNQGQSGSLYDQGQTAYPAYPDSGSSSGGGQ